MKSHTFFAFYSNVSNFKDNDSKLELIETARLFNFS